jgi:hypothetical protein
MTTLFFQEAIYLMLTATWLNILNLMHKSERHRVVSNLAKLFSNLKHRQLWPTLSYLLKNFWARAEARMKPHT